MTKDIKWLKEEVIQISENWTENPRGDFAKGLDKAVGQTVKLIDKLDEPEVLSQEWINEHKVARVNNLRKMTMDDVVPDENNIVIYKEVPMSEQELLDIYESAEKVKKYRFGFYLYKDGTKYAVRHPREVTTKKNDEFSFWLYQIKAEGM